VLVALAMAGCDVPIVGGSDHQQRPAAAPQASGGGTEQHAAEKLGFPNFATKNTTRVGGGDAIADAAGVALATFPSVGGASGPAAVSLVDGSDWQGGVAGSVLAGAPVRAPVLIGGGGVPSATSEALTALQPQGSAATDHAQVFRIGEVDVPSGLRHTDVRGADPADRAAAVARLRDRLFGGAPRHVVIATEDNPAFAMPAAAWAARSGDPVLFTHRDSLPPATLKALHGYRQLPIFVLGPSSAIGPKVERQIEKVTRDVRRVGGPSPVENAIAFARYSAGSFGWNLNDPGHGFVLASTERPLDAAAAAALSTSGTWGALLLTDDAAELPPALHGYLLDLKPGYQADPTRAVYNHVWLIGDANAISVAEQAQADDLAELTKVGSPGGGGPTGESRGAAKQKQNGGKGSRGAKGAPPKRGSGD
jgi:hypothetical protein